MTPNRYWLAFVFLMMSTLISPCSWVQAAGNQVVQTTINGLTLSVDSQTGNLVRLEHPGPRRFLEAQPDQASILDVAYPIEEFEALRLAPRYCHKANIDTSDQSLTISWPELEPNRPFPLSGKVGATVHIRAAPDGRSLIFSCTVKNQSQQPVRQVLFPDLMGLIPFAGEDHTQFRAAGVVMHPFQDLRATKFDRFYATDGSFRILSSGDLNDTKMILRWYDVGSVQGGFSVFPLRWGWDPHTRVFLHLSEATHKLRLMNEHDVMILPGTEWSSGEFWMTPHKKGWARGIEPYRTWVEKHINREYPIPDHVRNGLGFRSVWMCQNNPQDPLDAIWTFQDLVPLAHEARRHGLSEMVAWIWNKPFTLPLPTPYPHLGTEQDLIQAVKECKQIGVNVSLFVSVLQAEQQTAARYGLKITPGTGNWTYHSEFLPRFNPFYASRFTCTQVDTTNAAWQKDVCDSCQRLVDQGLSSICWDQYWSVPETPNMLTLTSRIRGMAKQKDPESTFSGEELRNFELDSDQLDYTWNWGRHEDLQPLVSVFRAPRINANINRSADEVKRCFADNLYVNVWPTKPDSPNGSDWIESHPQLSSALRQCAKLREQFLEYFTRGTFIGDCVLARPCDSAHVSCYTLSDRMLVIAINTNMGSGESIVCDFTSWLDASTETCSVQAYDADGNALHTTIHSQGTYKLDHRILHPQELALFEVTPILKTDKVE